MEKNPPKEVGLLRKFVSTACSITTGQVGLPLEIVRLDRNLTWLKEYDINPLTSDELNIIEAYYGRISELPIEQERLVWAPDKLEKLDEKLERITAKYRPELMEIMHRIVAEAA